MPRLFAPALLISLLAFVPSCRASKAEIAAVQHQLSEIQSEQQHLHEELSTIAAQETNQEDIERNEQRELESALVGVMVRVAALEDKLSEIQEQDKAQPRRPTRGRPDPHAVYKVEIGDSPTKGSANALVTIVMWTDYQCPYCARVQDTLDQVAKEYGQDVRFVHKHNPLSFHPRAMPAALAAEAAGRQGKFWKMHDRIFDHPKNLSDKDLRKSAKKLGLSLRRFDKDIEKAELRKRIKRDQEQGIRLGARGTPAFFVNGRFLSGAQPFENFQTLIDEEMTKARRLVDSGVPRGRVYETTISEGKTKV